MLSRRAFLAAATPALHAQKTGPEMFADAEAYERFMGRWSRLIAPLLADFARLPEKGRVLDVGSGTGSLSFEVARRASVTGIDPSKEYVAYASSRNPLPGRAAFEVGDAQSLRFADAAFDAAVSLLVFNFIPDPAKALAEVRRVTRPGGPIVAAVWDYGDRMGMLRAFWDATVETDPTAEKLDEKHMRLCRKGELGRLWTGGHLDRVEERPIEVTTRFSSFADYWEPFLLGQGPAGAYVRRLTPERQSALRNATKRRLSVSSENDPLTLPARVWAVIGFVPPRP